MSDERRILVTKLGGDIKLLDRATQKLEKTFIEMSNHNINIENIDERSFELIDLLCSRFLRSYEVLTKQVITTILKIVVLDHYTFIDLMNCAEKLELVSEASKLDTARKLRNLIAHEYLDEEWIDIVIDVQEMVPFILDSKRRILDYKTSVIDKI